MTGENPHKFYEVTIPYEKITPERPQELVSAYNELLLGKIFPAIDELTSKKLIDTYHFLTTDDLDFHISIPKKGDLPKVKKILKAKGLPTSMKKRDVKHKRLAAEDEILRLNTEITRQLLIHPEGEAFHSELIQHQNNLIGMSNEEEVNFHLYQAVNWIMTMYMQFSGMERPEAIEKTKQDLVEFSDSLM